MSVRLRSLIVACAAGTLGLGLTGCGGGDDAPTSTGSATTAQTAPADGTRPVTDQEALVLARVLNRNYRVGGGRFSGSGPFPQGARVRFTGQIDWRRLRGQITFTNPSATGPSATKRLLWTKAVVYEQRAPGSLDFATRAPNPTGSPLDFYIALLARTSSPTIDNIAVIKEQGAIWVRSDTVGGRAVEVYRYGGDGRSIYWISDDGVLRRLEVRIANLGDQTATIDFSDRRPVRIALPKAP